MLKRKLENNAGSAWTLEEKYSCMLSLNRMRQNAQEILNKKHINIIADDAKKKSKCL